MNRFAMVTLCVAMVVASSSAGCASSDKAQFRLQQRMITLKTKPEGARVWHLAPPTGDPVNLGMTPLIDQPVMVLTKLHVTVQDPSNIGAVLSEINTARLRIEKAGYKPYEIMVGTTPGQTVERSITLEPAATRPAPTEPGSAPAVLPAAKVTPVISR
jgi:hypothetical protein